MVYDKASGRFVEKPRELVEFDLKNGNAKAKMDTEISMLRQQNGKSVLSSASWSPVRLTVKKKEIAAVEQPEIQIIGVDASPKIRKAELPKKTFLILPENTITIIDDDEEVLDNSSNPNLSYQKPSQFHDDEDSDEDIFKGIHRHA